MDFDGFEWDRGNRVKCLKHGVSIVEIEDIFTRVVLIAPDVQHSADEERFKAIGKTGEGRHVFVAFTLRVRDGENLVRPVSARYMHAKEIRYYEKATAGPQNG